MKVVRHYLDLSKGHGCKFHFSLLYIQNQFNKLLDKLHLYTNLQTVVTVDALFKDSTI